MKVESAFFSRRGRKEKNEDSLLPLECSQGVYWSAIADGMGGKAAPFGQDGGERNQGDIQEGDGALSAASGAVPPQDGVRLSGR